MSSLTNELSYADINMLGWHRPCPLLGGVSMERPRMFHVRRTSKFCTIAIVILTVVWIYHRGTSKERCLQENKRSIERSINPSAASTKSTSVGVSFFDCDNPHENDEDWKIFSNALERYKIFHREKLERLKSSPDGGAVKTLTWACSQAKCSGLGDQLFRLQYFLLLAMMSDRVFTIYWDEYLKRKTADLLPNDIDWTYFNRSKGMCADDKQSCSHSVFDVTSFWGFGWTANEFINFGKALFSSEQHITVTGQSVGYVMYAGNKSILDPGPLISDGMKKLGVQQVLSKQFNDTVDCGHDPLWYASFHKLGVHKIMEIPKISGGQIHATSPWIFLSHALFTSLFQFSHGIIAQVRNNQKSINIYNKNYLALHLRTGFLGEEDQEKYVTRFLHSGWKLFYHEKEWDCLIRHAIHLRDQMLGHNAVIYLSTDSHFVKDKVRSSYNDKNIIFSSLTGTHTRFSHSRCQTNDQGHSALWNDFIMLADAKVIIHPDSSFSVNAGFLKPIPHQLHSWVMFDKNRDCLASYMAGNVSCIC